MYIWKKDKQALVRLLAVMQVRLTNNRFHTDN